MLKGFKDFIFRGNIIELAIAVVIGTAFTAIVAAFSTKIINPILAAIGGVNTDGFGFYLRHLPDGAGDPKTFIDIGGLITAIITFLITAAVVYFVFVLPMNKINARFRKGKEEELDAAPTDVELLIEIRDLLQTQARGPLPASTVNSPSSVTEG